MKKTIYIFLIFIISGAAFFLFSHKTIAPVNTTNSISIKTIRIESGNFYFSPKKISAKKDQKIIMYISSKGNHTFTIDELGVNVPTPDGQITKVEFTPNKTGNFTFYCAIPDHKEAGQIGTIIVN